MQSHVVSCTIRKLNLIPAGILCSVVSWLFFPSHLCLHFWYLARVQILLFWLLLSCYDSQSQSLEALQGMSWGPSHFHSYTSLQLLLHRSHSTSFTPLRSKSFLHRESIIQQVFNRRQKRGVGKKIIVMRLYFSLINFLLNRLTVLSCFCFSLMLQHQNQIICPETTLKCALVE